MTFSVSVPLITTLGCQKKYGNLVRHFPGCHNIHCVFKSSFEKWAHIFIKNPFSTSKLQLAKTHTHKKNSFTYIAAMHFKFYFTEHRFYGRLIGINNQKDYVFKCIWLALEQKSNHFNSCRNSELLACKCAEHSNRMRRPHCQLKERLILRML